MNDPRTNPVPGAEIEREFINGIFTRKVLSAGHGVVVYVTKLNKKHTCSLATWRKWAFGGHVVARGQE